MTSVQISVTFRLALLSAAALTFAFSLQHAAHPANVRASSSANARGAELFATHGCAHCHGKDGVNGELAPDLQHVRDRMNAAQLTRQIREGSKGMPAFGPDQLTDAQVSDLVVFLRTKRKNFTSPLAEPPAPPAPKPDPDSGL
jgi:mono/diheme cytochrome c family protein